MKRTSLLISLVLVVLCARGQQLQTTLHFTDAAGNTDALILGFDNTATGQLNPAFGEMNIVGFPWNNPLEVRFTNHFDAQIINDQGVEYQTKKRVIPKTLNSILQYLELDIKTINWPVTMQWDTAFFSDSTLDAITVNNAGPTYQDTILVNKISKNLEESGMASIPSNYTLTQPTDGQVSAQNVFYSYVDPSSNNLTAEFILWNKRIRIDPTVGYSIYGSPNWNLVFNDEFDGTTLNSKKWNISTNTDDGLYGTYCKNNHVDADPSNVSVSTGFLNINFTNSIITGHLCSHHGAEVKTFSTSDKSFQQILFLPGSYLEIRAKRPCGKGIGSAGWVYGTYPIYNEIDLWEHDGDNVNVLYSTYLWKEYPSNRLLKQGSKVIVKDKSNPQLFGYGKLDLCNNYVTYGLQWDADSIIWYINDQKTKVVSIYNDKPANYCNWAGTCYHNYVGPFTPLTVRFGTQADFDNQDIDNSKIPQNLSVDFVRVYKRANTNAVDFTQIPSSLCEYNTGGALKDAQMKCHYYPDVTYSWTSSAVTFVNHTDPSDQTATAVSGLTGNKIYPITVQSTFPSGYSETSNYFLYVPTTAPSKPYNTIKMDNYPTNECFYSAYLVEDNKYDQYEWNETIGGSNGVWSLGAPMYKYSVLNNCNMAQYDLSETHYIEVQALNDCGTSPSISATINTPTVHSSSIICNAKRDGNMLGNWIGQSDTVLFTTVKVFNILGQIVKVQIGTQLNVYNSNKYVNELPTGLYILMFYNKDGSVMQTRKIATVRN